MPRRSGGGRSPSPSRGLSSRSSVPARTAPPPPPPAPVQAPPSAVGQPRQPGMFAQMATTAAGVAVGSAVGHTLGAAMMGGHGGGSNAPAEQPPQQQQPVYSQQQAQSNSDNPCAYQMRQFIECAQSQHDITLCQGFNEALRDCRVSYGLPLQ